jgi:hypothetical protein
LEEELDGTKRGVLNEIFLVMKDLRETERASRDDYLASIILLSLV